jgi:hypothetical protein
MSNRAASLPTFTTPEELAAHLGASERFVRDEVRALGCFAKIGKRVIMLEHHVEAFMEAMECRSNSTGGAKSGTSEERLPVGDTEALHSRLTRKKPNAFGRTKSPKLGNVVSMGQARD